MITFRKASLSDIPALNTLVNSAYRGESSKGGWTTEADLISGQRTDPEALKEMLQAELAELQLAEENNLIIGCIYLSQESGHLYFGMLTVRPDLQGKGIGKLLLRRAEELGRMWSLKSLRMTVISDRKELIAYYERQGFCWNGDTEPFPDHDPRNGQPQKKLIFHVYVKEL